VAAPPRHRDVRDDRVDCATLSGGRPSTSSRAESLGVTGYARNLDDGRVEVLACGEPDAVQALCDWLWEGPPAAHVTSVDVDPVATESLGSRPRGFVTA
jgi:acylphosphatase